MMVDMQQLSIIEIRVTVFTTGSVRSHIAEIMLTDLLENIIQVRSDYIQRCIRRNGGGICRYEIGPVQSLAWCSQC